MAGITEEEKNRIVALIEENRFTDMMDASIEESFFEYGIVRHPATGRTFFARLLENDTYRFDWNDISLEDVEDYLTNHANQGFFSFIGSSLEEELSKLSNDNLTGIIFSINQWDGYFSDSLTYQWDVDDFIEFMEAWSTNS